MSVEQLANNNEKEIRGWGGKIIDIHRKKKDGDKAEATEEKKDGEDKPEEPPKKEMLFVDVFEGIGRGLVRTTAAALRNNEVAEKAKRVFISISSGGGNVNDSLSFIDTMKAWPQPHVYIAASFNASAAVDMIMTGDLRLAYPNARFMQHDMGAGAHGSVDEMEEKLRDSKELRQVLLNMAMEYVGLTKKEAEKILLSNDKYMNAVEAMNLGTKGLIDGIIIKALGDFKYVIRMRDNIEKTIDLYADDYNEIRDLTKERALNPVTE